MTAPKTETILNWTDGRTLNALAERIAAKPTGVTFLFDDERKTVYATALDAIDSLRAAAEALEAYHAAFREARCMR